MKTKTKPWLVAIIGLLLVILALGGIKAGQIKKMIEGGKAFIPPPEAVASAKAAARPISNPIPLKSLSWR